MSNGKKIVGDLIALCEEFIACEDVVELNSVFQSIKAQYAILLSSDVPGDYTPLQKHLNALSNMCLHLHDHQIMSYFKRELEFMANEWLGGWEIAPGVIKQKTPEGLQELFDDAVFYEKEDEDSILTAAFTEFGDISTPLGDHDIWGDEIEITIENREEEEEEEKSEDQQIWIRLSVLKEIVRKAEERINK